MGRPREHDEHTAELLLDEAESLLRLGGLDAVTVRAVAEAAGVSVRGVYASFAGKEGLVGALVGRAFLRLAVRVETLHETEDPVADLVRAGTTGFRTFALDQPHLYRLTFEQTLLLPTDGSVPPWAASGRRGQRALGHWVTRALEAAEGAPPPADRVHDVVAAFHAGCQGLASCEVNGVWRAMGVRDPERVWGEAVTALATGLVRSPRAPA